MHIEIYSREGCAYCDAALDLTIQLCDDSWHGKLSERYTFHTYDKFMLNRDFTRNEMIQRFPTAKTYPQITIDGEHIGGFTEYNEYITSRFYPRGQSVNP